MSDVGSQCRPVSHPSSWEPVHRSTHTHDYLSLSQAALGEIHDAVIAFDDDLRITYCNGAAERLYGFAAPDVMGAKFSNVVSLPSSPVPSERGVMGFSDGPAVHVSKSGERIEVRVSLIKPRVRGSRHQLVAIIHDERPYAQLAASMDERLGFERLLADLSARFNSLYEEEIDGEIELWLRRLVELLGVERSSFAELNEIGEITVTHSYAAYGVAPFTKTIANDKLPWLVKELRNDRTVVLSRIPEDLPKDAVLERLEFTRDGMRSGVAIPLRVGDAIVCTLSFGSFRRQRPWPAELVGRLRLAGSVFANAIARRRAKRLLEQKQQELAHVARVAAMGELASVIAHELDQPLTAIVSNAEAIRSFLTVEEPDLLETDAALNDVIDAAMRVSEIVQRERRLLRKREQFIEIGGLNEIIREIELFIRADARRDGANVSFKLLPGLPMIKCDRVQLQQVVLNLTRNALQAMVPLARESRHLRIRTACKAGEVVLAISDTGPRVDDSRLAKMFQPFFTTKSDGLGMGLSISKSIIESHHGHISASRNSGDGLTVHVGIPVNRETHATH
jgi:PAS domain S-box-containing protein